MDVVFVLLPLSLVFVGVAVVLFIWAVKKGQFDDLETPAVRMLFDDEPAPSPEPLDEGNGDGDETIDAEEPGAQEDGGTAPPPESAPEERERQE